jgi:tetratricopeptide (TPR) repeat protein/Zn finger protein HypA/HybF involved in hydrogenase expression
MPPVTVSTRARCVAPLVSALLIACGEAPPGTQEGSSSTPTATFVSSTTCATCHAQEHTRWQGSHHDLAMQEATEATVLGDFSDVTFESAGRKTRFFREGGAFYVNAEGPDGQSRDYQVHYTFGVDPLQQYLLAFPGGRLQCLDVAWDTEGRRWFDLNGGERLPADDPYHWSGRFQTWNLQCADCHSTAFRKNHDPVSDTYESTWEELDVGCEACHGAGSRHVELAMSWATDGRPVGAPSGFAVAPVKADPAAVLNSCAPCHSRRTQITEVHFPGTAFADDYRLALLTPDLYHADGQILEEVYVHGSFLQSKMHQSGVSCIDCHDPHSLDLWLPGDAVCTQCHSEQAPIDRFPTLKSKLYADPTHHHHDPGTEGASCVACHMPERTYMVIDPRRDHSLRVPRPDLTISLGTPNACNGCHEDQDAAWATERIEEWTGSPPLPHYGEALGANDSSDRSTIDHLLALPFDRESPGIIRASALERFPDGAQVTSQAAMAILTAEESDPWLKVAALSALVGAPPQLLAAIVPAHLDDPARVVRVEAAQVLAGPAEESLGEEDTRRFSAAFAEFQAAQAAAGDSPFSHLNLGVIAERRGKPSEAAAHYRRALELDRDFLPAVFNLSTLLESTGERTEAERLLRAAIESYPEEGELRYNLGLLLAGAERLEEAAQALTAASRRLPDRPRVHYNLGLARSRIDDRPRAEEALLRAHDLDQAEPDYLYALATFYLQGGEFELAHEWTSRLVEAVPGAPGPLELRAEIERRMRE